ncbi:hypothetical protein [Nostoc sp. MG11]|uniref:hypothetical protein n=1 Tax=Nostoc sp. MG11 TaxID=2721166 RepID=UPI001D013C2A|nr:hypothetical protein [Nostoc sp. MG11]
MQQWVEVEKEQRVLRAQRAEKFKSDLFWFGHWIGSGRSGIFVCAILVTAALVSGLAWGINTPNTILCPKIESFCYQMRLNRSSVLLNNQVKKVLQEYERNKSKPRRRR